MKRRYFTGYEIKWMIGLSIFLMIVTIFPALYGWYMQDSGSLYTGIYTNYRIDYNVYFSYIQQAKDGATFFYNAFTSEPQPALFFAPEWLVIGRFAKMFHLSAQVSLHIARVLLIPVMIVTAYGFFATLYPFSEENVRKRIMALLIFSLSGGFGFFFESWFYVRSTNQPIDMLMPEGFPFQVMMHFPHWILAYILIACIMMLCVSWLHIKQKWSLCAIFVSAMLLAIIHPYDAIPLSCILIIFGLWFIKKYKDWKGIVSLFAVFFAGISIPGMYFIALSMIDPVFEGWFQQNITLSPPWYQFIFGFGLLTPLALYGLIAQYKKKDIHQEKHEYSLRTLLIIWMVVGAILLFIPSEYQRRFVLGLFFPISFFACEGIGCLLLKIKIKWTIKKRNIIRTGFIALLIIFLPLTSIYALWIDMATLQYFKNMQYFKKTPTFPYFIERDYIEAFAWIESNTPKDSVFLTSWEISNILPAYISRKVFFGHTHQTVQSKEKEKKIDTLSHKKVLDSEDIDYLKRYDITYFIQGPHESIFFATIKDRKDIKCIYNNETVNIYTWD